MAALDNVARGRPLGTRRTTGVQQALGARSADVTLWVEARHRISMEGEHVALDPSTPGYVRTHSRTSLRPGRRETTSLGDRPIHANGRVRPLPTVGVSGSH